MSIRRTPVVDPRVKEILTLLGKGAVLSAIFLFPGASLAIKDVLDEYEKHKREKEFKQWQKFNLPKLKYILKRLHRQKLIQVSEKDGFPTVQLTERGKLKSLTYKIEDMAIQPPAHWDHKWRIIIYDISKFRTRQQRMFRRMLKKLNMLPLQKSVYLNPYPCKNEVDFLREYFGVGEEVLYIIAEKLEHEEVYQKYFGL